MRSVAVTAWRAVWCPDGVGISRDFCGDERVNPLQRFLNSQGTCFLYIITTLGRSCALLKRHQQKGGLRTRDSTYDGALSWKCIVVESLTDIVFSGCQGTNHVCQLSCGREAIEEGRHRMIRRGPTNGSSDARVHLDLSLLGLAAGLGTLEIWAFAGLQTMIQATMVNMPLLSAFLERPLLKPIHKMP
jgi:hypothetical protein